MSIASTDSAQFRVIGARPLRPDGVDKVTGRAVYGADVTMPGLLHGKVLRSPHAHARIVRIDTAAAAALPGVRAVATAADMPAIEDKIADLGESIINLRYSSSNMLARDKVLYYGHAVAAVAADTPHIAEEAARLIAVEYELLPPVLDGKAALAGDAPILLDDLRTNALGQRGDRPTNVAEHIRHERGDLAAGFAAADVIVEREFHTATVHQGYIEPHNATALWSQDGTLQIWCSTQGAFAVQEQLAELLDMPISAVQVTPTEIGGGFGGKLGVYLEPLAALLSRKAGHRPVKMTMTRAEVLAATGPTSGSYIKVKMGATREGKLTAAEATLIYEAGAFPGSPVGAGCGVILAPYKLEHLRIDGYDVVVNRPKAAAYRAPGGTNAAFASESVVDELAQKLGIDPLEFRRRNAVVDGDRRPDGPLFRSIGYTAVLDAAASHPHYLAPLTQPHSGRGIAAGFWFNWGGKSSASAAVNRDGTVSLVEGSTDIGGSRASIAMQLAETLGIPYADVRPQVAGTGTVGYNDVTGGSRTTFGTGWAVYELGKKILAEMCQRAADLWEVPAGEVTAEAGVFRHGEQQISFKELAAELDPPVAASASVHPKDYGPGFGLHIVDVAVDPETGKATILRYTALQDVGRAIHPSYVEGQLQGGVAQGVGWALNEEYVYDAQGRLLNASLLDYRMPVAPDLPMIDTVLVEVPHPGHPYGVRGVGETPIVPPAGAVANAIARATGVRMTELPMSPPRVMEALWASG
jgi:xanthine dehydrogenase molybdenum-binding subunit